MMKKLKSIILSLSFLCLVVCVIFFVQFFIESVQDRKEQEELIRKKQTAAEVAIPDAGQTEHRGILNQYRILYEENSDLIGWIRIEDTPLDYPVMQNKEDKEFYLHRNFNRDYEYSGLPFLDINCSLDPPSSNLIIYGHNMKSDAMFSCLTEYLNQDFYREHPTIQFDTLYEEGRYEIIAVILSQVYKKTDDVFKFYQFVQTEEETEFNAYVQNMKKLSLYETGIGAAYGDQLLTIVTCNYHTKNGRLAVLAKKTEEWN
ncbi:MAG: class B sortase [Eubacteriales bacterium]|nr:class B sortase [Eubacteriales bacterium]